MNRTLAGKTIFISGGSRGIGLAIALRAARDGAITPDLFVPSLLELSRERQLGPF